jgi:hypothetical protein
MKKSLLVLLFALGVMISSLPAAQAASPTVTAQDPEEILNIAKGFGSATLATDRDGDPKISGRINGTSYSVYFFGCKNGDNCKDIQFVSGWSGFDITLEQINDWNSNRRYGKSYLDDENDPVLIMPVNLHLGVTRENLEDTFEWWTVVLEQFGEEVLGK